MSNPTPEPQQPESKIPDSTELLHQAATILRSVRRAAGEMRMKYELYDDIQIWIYHYETKHPTR